MEDIVASVPPSVVAALNDSLKASLPAEKAKAEADSKRISAQLRAGGSQRMNGVGQKIGKIPAIIFHRWNLQYPGCWDNDEFVSAFFEDNPEFRAPGWKPKSNGLRHGTTFINGEATGKRK